MRIPKVIAIAITQLLFIASFRTTAAVLQDGQNGQQPSDNAVNVAGNEPAANDNGAVGAVHATENRPSVDADFSGAASRRSFDAQYYMPRDDVYDVTKGQEANATNPNDVVQPNENRPSIDADFSGAASRRNFDAQYRLPRDDVYDVTKGQEANATNPNDAVQPNENRPSLDADFSGAASRRNFDAQYRMPRDDVFDVTPGQGAADQDAQGLESRPENVVNEQTQQERTNAQNNGQNVQQAAHVINDEVQPGDATRTDAQGQQLNAPSDAEIVKPTVTRTKEACYVPNPQDTQNTTTTTLQPIPVPSN